MVDDGRSIVSSVVSSQIDLHARYGGVVPELAGRAHVELLTPVLAEALDAGRLRHLGDRASTPWPSPTGPGLIGSLLVGVAEAKALALAWGVPFVGVNHLEAHLFASLLEQPDLGWPLVVLLVSGGHTLLIEVTEPGPLPAARRDHRRRRRRGVRQGGPLPRPRLPGRPGHRPDRRRGRPARLRLPPAPARATGYDFSFSGLKTSVVNTVRKHPEAATADVAASFQEAVVDVLVAKARRAAADVGRHGAVPGRRGGGQLAAAPAGRGGLRRGRDRGVPAQPGPVHRQRRHGGRRRLVAPAPRGPSPLTLGADPNLRLVA